MQLLYGTHITMTYGNTNTSMLNMYGNTDTSLLNIIYHFIQRCQFCFLNWEEIKERDKITMYVKFFVKEFDAEWFYMIY